jgi:hypothetical protein
MANQPVLIDALGENPIEPQAPAREGFNVLEYLQNLSGTTPMFLIEAESPRFLSGHDLLSKLMSQRGSEIPMFSVDFQGVGVSARRTLPVVEAIDALQAGNEDEVRPTEFAYKNARSTIESAYGEVDGSRAKKRRGVPAIFPKPLITTDDVGGIRLSWITENKQVRANFGARPELRSYVYFESGSEHDVEPLDPQHLAGRLAWLTAR